ncbi:hypothetical protein NMP99_01240 [Glutamicibacter mishrai]|uniref:hypothetical protein n=1 Tax=Glutamicibacter mishrai TaxID=1775880 RepID=UPI0020CD5A39|nr:hypothetical protein [Glutamicibacter mishrai]UTT39964.1 hypothetical protein NMP99_01240 [Glutamicibacter mishrai]
MSAEELKAYSDSQQGWLNKTGHWVGEHWEVIAGVGLAVAGVALTCTGVGGPAGIALMAASGAMIGGGVSMASQELMTGSTDWSLVGKDALVGAITGPLMKFGAKPLSMLTDRVASVGTKAFGSLANGAKNVASKIPGVVQKGRGAMISARQSLGAQVQILKSRATTVYRGVASKVRSGSQQVWRGANRAKDATSAVYRGVSSGVSASVRAAASSAKTGTTNFFRENWTDMWKTSVANSQVEGVGNLGWAYVTDDRSQPGSGFTFREGLGAYAGGAVSGGLGGLGPLAKVVPEGWGVASKISPYALSIGGGEAGLFTEKGITGQDVTIADHAWTVGGSTVMTHFPGPKVDDPSLPANQQHLSPSMIEYGGYGFGAKMASVNIDGAELVTSELTGQGD